MKDNCVGCKQIAEENFPFKQNYIDMEGCGYDLSNKNFSSLTIFFCPVCGEKLPEPKAEEEEE